MCENAKRYIYYVSGVIYSLLSAFLPNRMLGFGVWVLGIRAMANPL